MIVLLILLLIIVLLINIILSNSINEHFDFGDPNNLIYLYDTDNICPSCKDINTTWTNIETEVPLRPLYYNLQTKKYKITEKDGKTIANENKINSAPAIILKLGNDNSYKIYNEKTQDMSSILTWARNLTMPINK